MNKFLGVMLLVSSGIGFIAVVFDTGTTTDLANGFYTLAGLGFYVFGTWTGIRLLLNK